MFCFYKRAASFETFPQRLTILNQALLPAWFLLRKNNRIISNITFPCCSNNTPGSKIITPRHPRIVQRYIRHSNVQGTCFRTWLCLSKIFTNKRAPNHVRATHRWMCLKHHNKSSTTTTTTITTKKWRAACITTMSKLLSMAAGAPFHSRVTKKMMPIYLPSHARRSATLGFTRGSISFRASTRSLLHHQNLRPDACLPARLSVCLAPQAHTGSREMVFMLRTTLPSPRKCGPKSPTDAALGEQIFVTQMAQSFRLPGVLERGCATI